MIRNCKIVCFDCANSTVRYTHLLYNRPCLGDCIHHQQYLVVVLQCLPLDAHEQLYIVGHDTSSTQNPHRLCANAQIVS